MKIYKFVYKFVDHVDKICHHICVNVTVTSDIAEWVDDGDIEKYLMWMNKVNKWDYNLCEKVCDDIISPALNSEYKNKNAFNMFKLDKSCCEQKSTIYNVGTKQGNDIMREGESFDMTIFKYCRGDDTRKKSGSKTNYRTVLININYATSTPVTEKIKLNYINDSVIDYNQHIKKYYE
jgi:hypothetical protein